VVAEKVEQLAALGFLFEPVQAGKFAFAGGVRFEDQIFRPAGRGGRDERGPGRSSVMESPGARSFSSSDVANKTCSANSRSSMAGELPVVAATGN
jgi:hypothetical protein